MRYETLLLDFHGTFTNQKARLAHALNEAYQYTYGRNISQREWRGVLDRPEGTSVLDFLNQSINGHLPADLKDGLLATYKKANDRIYVPKYRFLLRELGELGITCAIVTNGQEKDVRSLLEKWGLADCVVDVYGRGAGALLKNVRRKPSAQVIDLVIEDLRSRGLPVKRDRTLMVGDYKDDIGAGNNAGVHTAFLVTGPNQLPEYYEVRPTYALIDTESKELASAWLQRENAYTMRDLPKIVSGEI